MTPTRRANRVVVALASIVLFAVLGCGPADELDEQGVVEEDFAEDYAEDSSELIGCGWACGNCVDYAKCRQPGYKKFTNLYTVADKQRTMNSALGRGGCVAVFNYNHVAYVKRYDATASGRVYYIAEGNWNGACNERRGTKGGLNIAGFWCP